MAPITLYDVSISTFARGLATLKHILEKAAEHAKTQGLDADAYATASLIDGMDGLNSQVQYSINTVKKCIWRLTGNEVESWTDETTTLPQLIAVTQRALDLVQAVSEASVAGKDDTTVELQMGKTTRTPSAKAYVVTYALPNFYFHLQTAYAILRAKGVPLGKTDYLASFLA
ncbi:uncharacterized protein SPSK_10987 [Sporothrix schenckii 1099-18]|uniref:DUF1993 domain-containing protein n=2 Tax=Sporothrix schenckii TaxID=29908 RepID=U7PWE6_SPOS1|nr:uncharacterized protein SPSK_10987 [Sporothrix schenckii 1099-18]ERS98810.1 hypothetical protein HMPREF1624_04000 [Sporothrix schenckii ATCC 58251]KJR83589.1 hypothetical protein SPSK_10987 [Sporothrix schenckii 1099-18]